MAAGTPAKLFDWLPVYALAVGRKVLKGPPAGVALFVALSSKGSTGEDATIDGDRLATELGVSARQVWRLVEQLADDGWIERTAPPIRGKTGRPGTGRKARYRLTVPRLDLSLDTGLDGVTELSVTDV